MYSGEVNAGYTCLRLENSLLSLTLLKHAVRLDADEHGDVAETVVDCLFIHN